MQADKKYFRIGGKGMTRERDRIQENANKYIVKNCRAYNKPWCGDSMDNCINCTDCVIKQVINYCLEQNLKYDTTACEILQLFDIEEINK